jgi:hypothetical protein
MDMIIVSEVHQMNAKIVRILDHRKDFCTLESQPSDGNCQQLPLNRLLPKASRVNTSNSSPRGGRHRRHSAKHLSSLVWGLVTASAVQGEQDSHCLTVVQ